LSAYAIGRPFLSYNVMITSLLMPTWHYTSKIKGFLPLLRAPASAKFCQSN
jgi:hypothetical protein